MIIPMGLHKNIFTIVLIVLISGIGLSGSAQDSAHDNLVFSAIGDDETDISFLTSLSQLIIRDQTRLSNLNREKNELEPIFKISARQFHLVDVYKDSLETILGNEAEAAIKEQEWKKLEDGLEYMLKRHRSINQQIQILEQKINTEQEAFSLAMKGKSGMVMDITAKAISPEELNVLFSDSIYGGDSLVFEKDVSLANVDAEYNWQIVEAERKLKVLKAEFEVARRIWLLVERLLTLNKDDYAAASGLAEASEGQLSKWKETISVLEEKLSRMEETDSVNALQVAIQDRIDQAQTFIANVETNLVNDAALVNNLQNRIDQLSALKKPLEGAVAKAANRINTQDRVIEYLRSPFSYHRLYSFLINKGPAILITIVLLFLFWAGLRWLIGRILKGLGARHFTSVREREERIDTLNRAIRSGLTVFISFIGIVSILSIVGIDISVLLGGAAVFSLAIAFGAQSLVKDFFTGFMILTENQYRVGNVVKIMDISGTVEDISLRTTILRDMNGVAHFIPHGEIKAVSNSTHHWSQVALEIGIAYKENIDEVMKVVMEVAQELKTDSTLGKYITGEPQMLGVDALADSAVIIKILIRTRPSRQWMIKREYLRRIKNRFDELGIEIPFPHRMIYRGDLPKENPEIENNNPGN